MKRGINCLTIDRKDILRIVKKSNRANVEKIIISQKYFDNNVHRREKLKQGTQLSLVDNDLGNYSAFYVYIKDIFYNFNEKTVHIFVEY